MLLGDWSLGRGLHSGDHSCDLQLQLDLSAVRCHSSTEFNVWERGVITRTASRVCGPGSTGHMHYLPDFSLPAAFRDGSYHHSLTSEEAEAQRCYVSAKDRRAPGQQNALHPLLPVLCGGDRLGELTSWLYTYRSPSLGLWFQPIKWKCCTSPLPCEERKSKGSRYQC